MELPAITFNLSSKIKKGNFGLEPTRGLTFSTTSRKILRISTWKMVCPILMMGQDGRRWSGETLDSHWKGDYKTRSSDPADSGILTKKMGLSSNETWDFTKNAQ